MPIVSPRALAAIPALIVFLTVGIVLVFVLPIVVAIAIAIVFGLAVGWIVVRTAPSQLLKSLGAKPLEDDTEPRLEGLVESICASHGITEPRLYVIEVSAIDALVVGHADDTRLVVTTGMLAELDRLELEAVVARELSLFGQGIQAATVLATIGPYLGPLGPRLRNRLLDGRRLASADIDGVKLTRYPPALASAFEKVKDAARVTDRPASRHLWMVGPAGVNQPIQPSLIERIDTLREL